MCVADHFFKKYYTGKKLQIYEETIRFRRCNNFNFHVSFVKRYSKFFLVKQK